MAIPLIESKNSIRRAEIFWLAGEMLFIVFFYH